MSQRIGHLRGALTREFARHYAEMAIVMLVGMAVLAIPAELVTDALLPGVDPDDPTLMLARMGVIMTLPMVPWMRWRGHGWRPCLEMAAAMIGPTIAVVLMQELGLVTGLGLLMTIEHVAMFAAMFGVMVLRPEEYSHRCGPDRATAALVASQR